MKKIKFVATFFRYIGTRNWHQGVDRPTPLQWLYCWRIGPKTAARVAYRIHFL